MIKKIILFVFFLFAGYACIAQAITPYDDHFLQELAHYQVKDLSQFIDRFNFQEHLSFRSDTSPNRYKNLISLLNLKDTALRRNPNAMAFIKYVCDDKNKVKLSYKDKNWYAVAHCVFLYRNKEKIVNIILKPETSGNNGYNWVIDAVQSDLFTIPQNAKAASLFINPMNHEVNFSELSKALIKQKDISAYTSNGYKAEALSAFLFYVRNGDIQFKQIKTVDFNFLQVAGWFFTVKDFFRVDYNSGWLIASIKKMNEQEKDDFKKNHLIE